MNKKSLLLLFGGESSEHEISIRSARNVYAAVDKQKYDVDLCYIDQSGRWWLLDEWTENFSNHTGKQLVAAMGSSSFRTLDGSKTMETDIILPILHGQNGEDGTVQGLADLMHIPIAGCGVLASALCMDKFRTKHVLRSGGIKVVPWVLFNSYDSLEDNESEIWSSLGDNLFVKPTRAGSSVGVSRVSNTEELAAAIKLALNYGTEVLIESAVDARELEVAILGSNESTRASDVGEILSGEDFYDYSQKYDESSHSKVILRADLPEETRQKIQDTARLAYSLLGCTGCSRVDFFLTDSGELYVNEVNTLPGFTDISMYPKLWQEQGVDYSQLISELIDDALSRSLV